MGRLAAAAAGAAPADIFVIARVHSIYITKRLCWVRPPPPSRPASRLSQPIRAKARAWFPPGCGQYLHVKCLAVRRTPITTHTLRGRRNVAEVGKIALSRGQPAAASSARISGRFWPIFFFAFSAFRIRLVRSAMVSGTRMLGAASVELGGPTELLAPNGRAPKII